MSNTVFRLSNILGDSLRSHPETVPVLQAFRAAKEKNPLAKFGSSDYPFSNEGHFKGFLHAKLTQDLSVVYKMYGANPRIIDIYGVYSHAELGTGNPANKKIQKQMGQRFGNATF